MRSIFLCLWGMLLLLSASAQKNLSNSKRTSAYTYVYRITPNEVKQLHLKGLDAFDQKTYLHSLVDSFPAGSQIPGLKPGNYLFLLVKKDELTIFQYTRGDILCKVIPNGRDLIVHLHKKDGQVVPDANVTAGNRKLTFRKEDNVYLLPGRKKEGIIEVMHGGVLYLVPVRNRYARNNIRQLLGKAIRKNKRHSWRSRFFDSKTKHEEKFDGYFAFNKPIYKPKDTVRGKAWIATKKGKLPERPLLLRLSDRNFDYDTIIAVIQPYRAGGYEFSFVLNDSLDLDLDEKYLLTLEEERSRKYDLDDYEGDLDDDEYAMKRLVLMRGSFKYEEYQLDNITFSARTAEKTHNRNGHAVIYCKATDENGLAVMDGRIAITVTPKNEKLLFFEPVVFIKDTLWFHEQELDKEGETKIIIPDSVFPAASFNYEIECVFLNSNNERQQQTLYMHYNHKPRLLTAKQQGDSLQVRLIMGDKDTSGNAILIGVNESYDTVQRINIILPAMLPIHPFVSNYLIVEEDTLRIAPNSNYVSVDCLSARTKDSIFIQTVNKYKLPCWYTIFAGQRIAQQGKADILYYKAASKPGQVYTVVLQYIFADQVYTENYTIPYEERKLTVKLDQPRYVYPGQRTTINVEVRDSEGNTVPDADLLLMGFTAKFKDADEPEVPKLISRYRPPRLKSQFIQSGQRFVQGASVLDWLRWNQRLGLDSIEYYKFLYPETTYLNAEPTPDSVTQISPFVISDGKLKAVHLLYIDEEPRFFRGAQNYQPYSFAVNPGTHTIKMRIHNKLVTVDSVVVRKGMKTVLSVNANAVSRLVQAEKRPDTLTKEEQAFWKRFMISLEWEDEHSIAWFQQHDKITMASLGTRDLYRSRKYKLLGPVSNAPALFVARNNYQQELEMEGGYTYNIEPGFVKMKEWSPGRNPFTVGVKEQKRQEDILDRVITGKVLDSLWEDFLDHNNRERNYIRHNNDYGNGTGRLRVGFGKNENGEEVFVRKVLLFKNDDPDFMRVYTGGQTDLGSMPAGIYSMMLILQQDRYFIKNMIIVRADGLNYYATGTIIPQKKDSFSTGISEMLVKGSSVKDEINNAFNKKYFNMPAGARKITGYVYYDSMPVPGATVAIRNTDYRTVTDVYGEFVLNVPEKGTLQISSVGYDSKLIRLDSRSFYDVKLSATIQHMKDVVVVGYGTYTKRSVTASVSNYVSSGYFSGTTPGLMIRGLTSVADSKPLIIVDGFPADIDLAQLDGIVGSVTFLKDTAATSIWGARAGNGAIIITTKKAMAAASGADKNGEAAGETPSSLRSNFRDHAYWFPSLRTDQQGKASVELAFPDDITQWKTFALAMTGNRQFGQANASVKAYKTISGALNLPAFAVTGDSLQVIGKAMNYGIDSFAVMKKFAVNGVNVRQENAMLRNSLIDSFLVMATSDTLKMRYLIQRTSDGYYDGEERKIPVFPRGVSEVNGFFAALDKDTLINWRPSRGKKVTFYAESSVMPVLLDEMDHVYRYEYNCNEQLASKLKALLLKKAVKKQLKQGFDEDKQVRELISKLNQSRNSEGAWGWWKNSSTEPWITLHVVEAMTMAAEEKFVTQLNKGALKNILLSELNKETGNLPRAIQFLKTMLLLDAKLDYSNLIQEVLQKDSPRSLYQSLRVLQLRHSIGDKAIPDSIIALQRRTVFGNVYWGDDTYHFFNNSVQNTIIMYKLLKGNGNYPDLLKKIRLYFLEKRKSGHWRNTYESVLILEAILPDLINEEFNGKPSALTIRQGSTSHDITSFPFTAKLNGIEPLLIEKKGAQPVYLTASESNWNAAPAKAANNFTVSSAFRRKGDSATVLKAGEPVNLEVVVKVHADASYVLVEIPIPAGCTYNNKSEKSYVEDNREHFLNKVSIFCSELEKGTYKFNVSLLPRYTGTYHLNPANASLMYFPVFFGREGMKKISIR